MSQKMSLKEQLTNWMANAQVHGKKSDLILHELLEEIINKLDGKSETNAPAPPQTPPPAMAADDDPPAGGNNPEAPDIP